MLDIVTIGQRSVSQRRVFLSALFTAALGAAGLMVGGPALAAETAPLPTIENSPIPFVPLGVWTSKEGESKDDFARRVGAAILSFTEQSGFEACGAILKEDHGSRYRITVTTNQAQIGCLSLMQDQPDYSRTGETLHTHPHISSFTPNANDAKLFPQYRAGRGRYPVAGSDFSATDFHSGPGYVVASPQGLFGHTRILYQKGPAQEQDLGRLPKYASADLVPDAVMTTQVALAETASTSQAAPLRAVGISIKRRGNP